MSIRLLSLSVASRPSFRSLLSRVNPDVSFDISANVWHFFQSHFLLSAFIQLNFFHDEAIHAHDMQTVLSFSVHFFRSMTFCSYWTYFEDQNNLLDCVPGRVSTISITFPFPLMDVYQRIVWSSFMNTFQFIELSAGNKLFQERVSSAKI